MSLRKDTTLKNDLLDETDNIRETFNYIDKLIQVSLTVVFTDGKFNEFLSKNMIDYF